MILATLVWDQVESDNGARVGRAQTAEGELRMAHPLYHRPLPLLSTTLLMVHLRQSTNTTLAQALLRNLCRPRMRRMDNIAPIPLVDSQHTDHQVQIITEVYHLLEGLGIHSRLSWRRYEQEEALVLFGGVRRPRQRPRLTNRLRQYKGV